MLPKPGPATKAAPYACYKALAAALSPSLSSSLSGCRSPGRTSARADEMPLLLPVPDLCLRPKGCLLGMVHKRKSCQNTGPQDGEGREGRSSSGEYIVHGAGQFGTGGDSQQRLTVHPQPQEGAQGAAVTGNEAATVLFGQRLDAT